MQKGRKQTRYDYRVKLTDSQNFITNKKLVKRITRISNINKEDTVIEIGTGKGHLTEVPNPATDIWLVMEKGAAAAFKKFIAHSKKYGFGSKKSLLTKKQVNIALKQACLPQAHENGVTLYIQWLCLFRCYRHIYGDGKQEKS